MKVDSGMGPMSAPPPMPEQGAPRRSGRFRVPALPTALVERRRLLDMLSDAVDSAPLTLVGAPAGSGKTVLVSHWARSSAPALAWMSASERDSDARTFWWHVRSAFAEGGAVRVGAKGGVFPVEDGAEQADLLADQLLQSGTRVVLVVDAADRLVGRDVFDGLMALTDGAAGLLRVVLTTRSEPPVPLHRYRVEGTVAEVGRDELAFTSAELATLLELHGLDADDSIVHGVLERTEGWAAGARMAALAMRPDGSTLERFAADYLSAEVLDSLREAEEHVLLHVGVVDEVSPDLAVALSGQRDAEARLRDLARRNAFVEVVRDRPRHHRVHPLLRDLLAGRRQAAGDGRDEELHRIASDWFGGEGQLAPAVEHAVTAGDWERAASWTVCLDGAVDLLLATSTGAALADRLRGMPDGGRPQLSLVRAALALADRDLDEAREHLARVDRVDGWPADPPPVDGRSANHVQAGTQRANGSELDGRLRLWAAVLAARLGELSGDDGAVLAAAGRALSMPEMNASGAPPRVAAQRALVTCSQGTAYVHAGRLEDASVALEHAVAAAVTAASDPLTLRCMSMLALAEACQGRLTHGQDVADAAELVAERVTGQATEHAGGTARPAALDLAHAWVALDRQDLPRAGHALTKVVQLDDRAEPPLLQWVSLLLRVRLKRDHGDGVSARRLLHGLDCQVAWLRRAFDVEASAVGLLASVAELRTSRHANPDGMKGRGPLTVDTHQVSGMLEAARIDWLRGDRRASRSTVAAALARAQGEQLRRPFTHASPEIRAMLRDDAELRSQANWLRPDHATASDHRDRRRDRAPVVEDLSERELEVLRHLSDLLTTEEIAAEMFISANTVRTHIRRILGKLSVSRRHEAVRRARELNLV